MFIAKESGYIPGSFAVILLLLWIFPYRVTKYFCTFAPPKVY